MSVTEKKDYQSIDNANLVGWPVFWLGVSALLCLLIGITMDNSTGVLIAIAGPFICLLFAILIIAPLVFSSHRRSVHSQNDQSSFSQHIDTLRSPAQAGADPVAIMYDPVPYKRLEPPDSGIHDQNTVPALKPRTSHEWSKNREPEDDG